MSNREGTNEMKGKLMRGDTKGIVVEREPDLLTDDIAECRASTTVSLALYPRNMTKKRDPCPTPNTLCPQDDRLGKWHLYFLHFLRGRRYRRHHSDRETPVGETGEL